MRKVIQSHKILLWKEPDTDTIVILFEKLVRKYSPFWGAVTNSFIANKYSYFDCSKGLTNTAYWVNYFNDSVLENIGAKKVNRLIEQYPDMHFENGILRIKDTAVDYEAEGDMQLHEAVHKELFCKNI